MARRPRIALLIESSRAYGRALLQGVAAHLREHGPWIVYHQERRLHQGAPAWMKDWKGDGIIARIWSRQLARQIEELRLPTVDLLSLYRIRDVPVIITDHGAVARLAADHLMDRGLRHFAYCGFAGIYYCEQRCKFFAEYLAEAGYPTSVYAAPRPSSYRKSCLVEADALPQEKAMAVWLRSLEKPVGLMACTDVRAQQVLNVCGMCDIAVPDEVAVLGVDNDDVLCELCDPPLSSVALNGQQVGSQAAALLDLMMQGGAPPPEKTLIPPLGVVTRRSTNVMMISDPDVAAAVRFIREHACDGIRIEDVVETVQISRSTLKRRFAKHLRRSPSAEIRRIQIQRVRELLAATRLPLAKIAELAGFHHVESMCKLFKSETGHTPGQYRRKSEVQGRS